MNISYAQNFEDVILYRVLQDIKNGTYIDVGAAWPVEHSVTKLFYENGWSGINVEPNNEFAALLEDDRKRDINLNIALSDEEGELELNRINDTGLSTLDQSISDTHIKNGWSVDKYFVSVKTLNYIFDQFIDNRPIHFLKIDVEGLEEKVIQGNDWSKNRPWIVVVESTLPLSQDESFLSWESILLNNSYIFCYADGLNRFYLADEKKYLLERFRYPPNVFDDYVIYDVVKNKNLLEITNAEKQSVISENQGCREELHRLACKNDDLRSENKTLQSSLLDQISNNTHLVLINKQKSDELDQLNEKYTNLVEQLRLSSNNYDNTILQLEELIASYDSSISWKLTWPLRFLNPKRLLHFLSHLSKRIKSSIFYRTKALLKRNPRLWAFLRARFVFSHKQNDIASDFHYFKTKGLIIAFSKGPFEDGRGIGRVTRELYSQFRDNYELIDDSSHVDIYFYSSIHWCPEYLPDNCVVMIHDVIPLLFPDKFEFALHDWRTRYYDIAHQAKKIVTITKSSAKDIAREMSLDPEKIEVIYNGIPTLVSEENSNLMLPEENYVVFFGSHDYHKNVEIIFEAFASGQLDDIRLLMIGDNEHCKSKVKDMSIGHLVHFMGRVSDADAATIISGSKALLFPSLYEGFGLPPFEAALLGVPSICSDRPAMNELLKDSCVFVDPFSVQEWVDKISCVVSGELNTSGLLNQARVAANQLTWEATFNRLHSVFTELKND